ncbi:MAG TPA: LLM class flavin-dependent oxidoreductase [Vicinamibacterales bacterium]|nr:LLM class flavin-dependent oxidoreductase [Vicinamibacterales bacterium]
MRLSALDFFSNPRESLALAALAEELGFHRYWIGEHHTRYQCANPLMLASLIAGRTKSIRLGTGATSVMLRNPYLTAEDARMAQFVLGDRLDLGVAPVTALKEDVFRAIVESPETRGNYVRRARELHGYVTGKLDSAARTNSLYLEQGPPMWILGMSRDSADLAGELGLGFCTSFHHGATASSVIDAFSHYESSFKRSERFDRPTKVIVVSGVCGDTEAHCALRRKAVAAAAGNMWTREFEFYGRPNECADQIHGIATRVHADEVMVLSLAMNDIVETNGEIYQGLAEAWKGRSGARITRRAHDLSSG